MNEYRAARFLWPTVYLSFTTTCATTLQLYCYKNEQTHVVENNTSAPPIGKVNRKYY